MTAASRSLASSPRPAKSWKLGVSCDIMETGDAASGNRAVTRQSCDQTRRTAR